MSDTREMVILLPVVLVPGIMNGMGGDGTWAVLEGYLRSESDQRIASASKLGEGYRLRGQSDYPTVYTVSYDTNNASFAAGATALGLLIETGVSGTYADRVALVGHSKGGLVARKYVQTLGGERVKLLVLAQSPQLGSWAAKLALGSSYNNMYPLWRCTRLTYWKPYVYDPPGQPLEDVNRELAELNGMLPPPALNDPPFPATVPVVFLWSQSEDTLCTKTRVPYGFDVCPGDGVVPAFSQLARDVDPNTAGEVPNPFDAPLVPNMSGANWSQHDIAGPHPGYMSSEPVRQYLFWQLYLP